MLGQIEGLAVIQRPAEVAEALDVTCHLKDRMKCSHLLGGGLVLDAFFKVGEVG